MRNGRSLLRRVFVSSLLLAGVSQAADVWQLTTADFKTEPATFLSVDAKTLTVRSPDGAARDVPLDSFVRLASDAKPKPPEGLVLCVADGQRLVGNPVKIDGPSLVWATAGVGEVRVPLESVLGVLKNQLTTDGLSESRTEDVAKLGTGDTVRGIVTDVTGDGFVVTPTAGAAVTVSPGALTSILFASPPGGRKIVLPNYLVRLASGTVLAAKSIGFEAGTLSLAADDQATVKAPLSQIKAIDHTGGPIAWLSLREPTKIENAPYFESNFPPRMDASVTGGPIRFGGITYARGIGAHSRSKLTFALQPGDQTFRTRYAIDGNQPVADVDVTISLDGKPVHQKTGVKAGELSPLIDIKLGDAKTLTLEVDYGKNLDVQDRLNWIEPAIVRASE